MNSIQPYNATNFGSAKLKRKGVEELCNTWGKSMVKKLTQTAEKAKNSQNNHLIVEENGIIKLKNEKYGEFVPCNPAEASLKGNTFSCYINSEKMGKTKLELEMPDEASARELKKSFGPGSYVPFSRLDLFNAMETQSNYKKAMIDNKIIDNIMKLSD